MTPQSSPGRGGAQTAGSPQFQLDKDVCVTTSTRVPRPYCNYQLSRVINITAATPLYCLDVTEPVPQMTEPLTTKPRVLTSLPEGLSQVGGDRRTRRAVDSWTMPALWPHSRWE